MNSDLIEVLFYKLYASILKVEKDEAKMYLSILRNEFEENPENFKLDAEQMQLLKHFGYVVDNGLFTNKFTQDVQIYHNPFDNNHFVDKEKELKRLVFENQSKLSEVIGEPLKIVAKELDVTYGRIDLLAKSTDTVYPIELKRATAKHGVVGQIEKYTIYYKLKLIYKLWKHVKGIVIANNFEEFTLKELRQNGVICIQYFFNKGLKFRRLDELRMATS